MKQLAIIATTIGLTAATARAQPIPDVPVPPDEPAQTDPPPIPKDPPPPPQGDTKPAQTPTDPYEKPPTEPKLKPLVPRSKYCSWTTSATRCMPEVLTTPTGWLLPQAVLYSRTTLDTGGGVSSDQRIGLGDVAEFGIATTDSIRERKDEDARSKRIQPYVTASFRLGVQEGRLFDEQPGVTLGFRKSFERHHANFSTRVAELTLVGSKHFGKYFAMHAGGAFWDASLEGDFDGDPETPKTELTLHDFDNIKKKQLRGFGGLEIRPLPRSQILIDLGWSPEFCYGCTGDKSKIQLKPTLSWGVRYEVARWMRFESGVRLPDIGEANLLEAQIFGQVTFTSSALHDVVESLK